MAEAEEDVPVPSGSDVDSDDDEFEKFPDDFKEYMGKELSWMRLEDRYGFCTSWVFDCAPICKRNIPERSLMFKKKIELALVAFTRNHILTVPLLVQFWDHITIHGRSSLTTQKRPFALIEFDGEINEGLCEYRMLSLGYKVYVDGETEEELGPVGRVFQRKLPESTPDVEYYSSKEYPRRKHALRCHVTESAVLPVFEPSSQNCVGVLELVTTAKFAGGVTLANITNSADVAFNALELVGLKSSTEYFFMQDNNKALTPALNEIKEVLAELDEDNNDAYEIDFVQTWVTMKRRVGVSCMGEDMSLIPSLYVPMEICECDPNCVSFQSVSEWIHLRKDNGIVGAALSSHNLLFCTDVAQLSIIEYPLAHYAKVLGFSGCFVICLRSSYTENEVYVLKVFLHYPTIEDRPAFQTSLCRVLRTLKQLFQTFKLASGEDLEEDLPIDVIDFCNGEKCCYTLEPHTIRTPPQPKALQNEGKMMQLDPPDHQSVDCVNNGRNVAIAEQNDIALTYSEEKVAKKTKRQHITCEDIEKLYEKKTLVEAADSLGVSRSTLKRSCRKHGIKEWPFRKINIPMIVKENSPNAELKPVKESVRGADGATSLMLPGALPSAQPEQPPGQMLIENGACQGSEMHFQPLAPAEEGHGQQIHLERQDTLHSTSAKITIKATFEGDTIRVQLSSTSGISELKNEVAKKLNLKSDTFKLKFLDDEKDIILMTSDDDLQEFLRIWKLPGGNTIRLLVERIVN